MATEIKAPTFPESVADGTIATWHKSAGEAFSRDELIVDIETDKVVIEVVAPEDGTLSKILKDEGDTVLSDEVIGHYDAGAGGSTSAPSTDEESSSGSAEADSSDAILSPAVRKLVAEYEINPDLIQGTGKNGRIVKEDVMAFIENRSNKEAAPAASSKAPSEPVIPQGERFERREPMSRLRAKIANRLVEAQQNMAMLSTFNEVNMKPIMDLRAKYKDEFEKRHDTRLGFMSFFVRASVEALKRFPAVNASIDGNDIIYHSYQDVGVAVSSPRGLVVPVLRNVDNMSLADIENNIRGYGIKARDGKLSIDDMTGGTFTVSNGGVFGSLLSTPIVNPPQTAILGMHKIQDRPMAVNGEVVILPMMYLALSYDHRLIDGKEAVGFLVTIKELLEEPERLLLGL
ncbi:2-oxoglutarate dehydrogenase complex dihydrolipoyllysine-residue succinyltransferase [Aliikangiella coralliicola]|uniref:Dihydrolipoyllysine-residue succinyltransferase component of 2-oxoglutarate dehydrogenase complex n=1 Tax=Aliikangiella coralliicola TaxID=2592383 RepID=A0A545UGX1_9GAMM|nr:2-oxoglutarate dehydrogenase complex dihydrolipoyllysine-residue succinyltransferase [Aliikangiella coralliicola]TQV88653.1 2-oxoglutarate dehydrogenase complex dihydrolipoyllysine-residue succinyltransferase [Aliikangiella coralliicola]